MPGPDRHAEYSHRLQERRARIAEHEKAHIQVGNIRLLIAISAAVIAWMAFISQAISALWLLIPPLLFIPLAIYHERIIRRRTVAERAARFYEQGLARLEDRWQGKGEAGEPYRDAAHPYADDLDIFGPGSLFELLCQARTRGGEGRLASWLSAPADVQEAEGRQKAIVELSPRLDLRELIFVLGEEVRDAVDTRALVRWAEGPPILRSTKLWLIAAALSLSTATSAIYWRVAGNSHAFLLALIAVASFGYLVRRRVLDVVTHIDLAVHDLGVLAALFTRMEAEPADSPALAALKRKLDIHSSPPSLEIARLHRLAEWIDSRDNVFVRVVGPPLLYTTHLAFLVERWRERSGSHIRQWVDALSDWEALLSLAGYCYERPDDPFPEFAGVLLLDGEELGHPLLAGAGCIRNSIRFDEQRRLIVVSGSNMSGKSTFLRTVGVNVVLAMAGAPVRARRLALCPLQTGAVIRVTDSLQGGTSRFYAEIKRIRQIVDLTAGSLPVLFLLDELLHGTNSHDRAIGAQGILRGLLDRGAIGLITTHDLALTAIADALAPSAANVHFEDHLEDGRLRFDYLVRPGVVQKSNALELMRSIGLDV